MDYGDEYGSFGGIIIDSEDRSIGGNLSQLNFVHHKSHMT
jgi:hypothetical protein